MSQYSSLLQIGVLFFFSHKVLCFYSCHSILSRRQEYAHHSHSETQCFEYNKGLTEIDYSAANEYIAAHYNIDKYFDSNRAYETIFDGRQVLKELELKNEKDGHYKTEKEILDLYGLTLYPSQVSGCDDNVGIEDQHWQNRQWISDVYLPHLKSIVSELFPNMVMSCFWNPMVRGSEYEISSREGNETPTANVASLVHIDTDVGAYSLDEFISLIKKNEIQCKNLPSFNKDQFTEAIKVGKKRFAILNFWRNISSEPVKSYPLGILSTKYTSSEKDEMPVQTFPEASPDMRYSDWYYFSNATKDEVIIFYQYDRLSTQVSDLWHCALPIKHETCPKRKSFDVRMLIVLDEQVPLNHDRYNEERTKPMLNLEESGCFCDEQAGKRS